MIRLQLICDDRIGIAQDILSVLVRESISLRGIEIGEQRVYIKLDEINSGKNNRDKEAHERIEHLIQQLRMIFGVHDIQRIEWLPSEREHRELETLLAHYPEAVASVDKDGKVRAASKAFSQLFSLSSLMETRLSDLLPDIDISEHLRSMNEQEVTSLSVTFHDKSFLVEVFALTDKEQAFDSGSLWWFREPAQVAVQLERWQRSKDYRFDEIIAASEMMTQCVEEAKRMSALDAPLLIQGETGTGKELFARATHLERTPDGPFIAVNCASLPDNAAEHELFGYAEGAFTGAQTGGKPGLLELANGGTLYLDDIAEMSPYLQSKLLRFLEEGTFRRVGNDQEIKVSVKVIASAQADLKLLCHQKRFREDLYYRLNVLNLNLPPLRKRKNEILPLANFFIAIASEKMSRTIGSLTLRAQKALQRYNWPGNVRELENIIFRAVSASSGTQINTGALNMPLMQSIPADIEEQMKEPIGEKPFKLIMEEFERHLFEYLYPTYPSSRKLAAKLGLSHTAVANKLKRLGLSD